MAGLDKKLPTASRTLSPRTKALSKRWLAALWMELTKVAALEGEAPQSYLPSHL